MYETTLVQRAALTPTSLSTSSLLLHPVMHPSSTNSSHFSRLYATLYPPLLCCCGMKLRAAFTLPFRKCVPITKVAYRNSKTLHAVQPPILRSLQRLSATNLRCRCRVCTYTCDWSPSYYCCVNDCTIRTFCGDTVCRCTNHSSCFILQWKQEHDSWTIHPFIYNTAPKSSARRGRNW